MNYIDTLIDKINDNQNNSHNPEYLGEVRLSDLLSLSRNALKNLVRGQLSTKEFSELYKFIQNEKKNNLVTESGILGRANPQLAGAHALDIHPSREQRDYDDVFPDRSDSFVNEKSVASMFSPAAYLTELYRESRNLHDTKSPYNLDKRRPDLAGLSLSQSNMDDEISTLSLSNDILVANVLARNSSIADYDSLIATLSDDVLSGSTPFNWPYEATRQAILLRDPTWSAFSRNPAIAQQMDPTSLLAIQCDIPPKLYELLVEPLNDITTDEALTSLIEKYFGKNVDITRFQRPEYIAKYYGLSYDEVNSFLSIITDEQFVPSNEYYKDGKVVIINNDEGELDATLITRTYTLYWGEYNYAELFPLKNGSYRFNFSINNNYTEKFYKIKIHDVVISENTEPLKLNTPTSVDLIFPAGSFDANGNVEISFDRYTNIGDSRPAHPSKINYQFTEYSFGLFLLKLNKLIRLYKAVHIPPSDILTLLASLDASLEINNDVLISLFYIRYYEKQFQLDIYDSLVLGGSAISIQPPSSGQPSQFDRLFNTPPLNGQVFSADGTVISLDTGDAKADVFRIAVLKRALRVNDAELYALWRLAAGDQGSVSFTCDMPGLSLLYRMKLLADVYGLSVGALAMLLSVPPLAGRKLAGTTSGDLNSLTLTLGLVVRWLQERSLTVKDIVLMTSDDVSPVLTPEIENLILTLQAGLKGHEDETQAEILIALLAPLAAASLGLDSTDTAAAVLSWINNLAPEGTTLILAAKYILEYSPGNITPPLLKFCQTLGQLAAIVHVLNLTSGEIALAVRQPGLFLAGEEVLKKDFSTLDTLSRFHRWLLQCGASASEVLAALDGGTATIALISRATGIDEQMLIQGFTCSGGIDGDDDGTDIKGNEVFSGWVQLDMALQWVDVAGVLGITPAGVKLLADMRYSSGETSSGTGEWSSISQMMQAGLDAGQTKQLHNNLDEAFSTALCAYVIRFMPDMPAGNRDALYSYLLIDNQVSAGVKTTRIAEAIASVQLYANRALSRAENDVLKTTLASSFFADWERYNKRYSTWAGVSELVYYPENYVDPTLRLDQTSMMDALLQQVGQSKLNDDTIDTGFKNYLTAFEKIANLKVISAYHDTLNDNTGLTWFTGESRSSPAKYYWRSVDRSQFRDGKFVASAWSEWLEITCAASPVPGFIRPVVFKSRLYILWLESKEVRDDNSAAAEDATYHFEYSLKLSYLNYDGTWATPFIYPADKIVILSSSTQETLAKGNELAKNLGMYCAEYTETGALVILFYEKKDSYLVPDPENPKVLVPPVTIVGAQGAYIYPDMQLSSMESEAPSLAAYVYKQLDTPSVEKVCIPVAELGEVSVTENAPATDDFVKMSTAIKDEQVSIVQSSGDMTVTVTPGCKVQTTDIDYNLPPEARALNQKMLDDACENIRLTRAFVNDSDTCHAGIGERDGSQYFYIWLPDGYSNVISNSDLTSKAYAVGPDDFSTPPPLSDDYSSISLSVPVSNPGLGGGYFTSSAVTNGNKYTLDDMLSRGGGFAFMFKNYANFIYAELPFIQLPKFSGRDMTLTVNIASPNNKDLDFELSFPAEDNCVSLPGTSNNMIWNYSPVTVTVPSTFWQKVPAGNYLNVRYTFTAGTGEQVISNEQDVHINKDRAGFSNSIVSAASTGEQYLELMPWRVRLNTLFASQLIAYAAAGIDTIFSQKTQLLPEPRLGKGFYTTLTLPRYNPDYHGDEKWVKVQYNYFYTAGDSFPVWDGMLSETGATTVTLFVPYPEGGWYQDNQVHLQVRYAGNENTATKHRTLVFNYDPDSDIAKVRRPDPAAAEDSDNYLPPGIVDKVSCINQKTEPMDFSGANALYFWELFYYTPMMISQRLLTEQNFAEATRWINYVWNPGGYYVDGEAQPYRWNTRPLEEDTSWNNEPLDTVDPDAVCQGDPMHYRVATFMRYLDMLITRGDVAYRRLERDTLNEAKMWYTHALALLGDEPYVADVSASWSSPVLADAASETGQEQAHQAMQKIRVGEALPAPQTANSLTGLFLPQFNTKLQGYWKTLAQRLYNLRHNLSIDGQPLMLPVYASPADPAALLNAAVNAAQGGSELPDSQMPLYRFPVILASAKELTGQLMQFGRSLSDITAMQDGAKLQELLQTQGGELMRQSLAQQEQVLAELDATKAQLDELRLAADKRYTTYSNLYDNNISAMESKVLDMYMGASITGAVAQALYMAGAAANMAPNIFGVAGGGMNWGALPTAGGIGVELASAGTRIAADNLSQSEAWRRRRDEWEVQRDAALSERKQADSMLDAHAIRRKAAELQKTYLETQLAQTQAQLTFLQNRFTSQALYSWLRGKLATIYYQFYDLTVSRCLMAQKAWQFELNDDATQFIRPGAWLGAYNGLLAGEALHLNLTQMESAWFEKDARALEVVRTISLAEVFSTNVKTKFDLQDTIQKLLNGEQPNVGDTYNSITLEDDILSAKFAFNNTKIIDDYPDSMFPGAIRKVKQVSVTLPALTGPYQDIQAILTVPTNTTALFAPGCKTLAISHGMNDSGQFQLDFNDNKYLPFEGLKITKENGFELQFPNAKKKQQALLESLTDIIFHIRYTIR